MPCKRQPLCGTPGMVLRLTAMYGATTAKGAAGDGLYRALLDVSVAMARQPTVEAVLQSLRHVLSAVCRLHGAHLWVLDNGGDSLRVLAFDREDDAPPIAPGTKIALTGVLAQAFEEQSALFIPDLAPEMAKYPALAPFAAESAARSAYVFPISTGLQRYGLLVVTKERGESFTPGDVEVLRSLASHVAIALECALARDRAEQYQTELASERDRLRLVLEITNEIASLDIHDVLRSASASIRSYFGSDFVTFWIVREEARQLQSILHDFPEGKGALADFTVQDIAAADFERVCRREAELWSLDEIEKLPPPLRDPLKQEHIQSLAYASLAAEGRALGLLVMGSRKASAFCQEHRELLAHIAIQMSLALDNALAHGRLHAAKARLEDERLYLESEIRSEYSFEDLIGKSPALRTVLEQVAIVAPTDSTVLLHGETGTGKELVARAIHNLSPRKDRTFVRLNCAAIPSGLVESELFGHERGAFTGALMQKRGRFELADRGTLFLDEIGDISLDLQPKLLRALQEREFERLGSTKTISVDVRLVAATHRDLPAMIRNNQFRDDLFYRLNVFPVEIPPLRDRREDIPLLIHYFVGRMARRMRKTIKSIPKPAMQALTNADWPGNVRELENFVERCVILTQSEELVVPRTELMQRPSRRAPSASFEDAERHAIIDALKATAGRIAGRDGAAERLGLKRTTLQNKMRRLNVTRADYNG
jgi:formate hydrogenlyase transcriptional activator